MLLKLLVSNQKFSDKHIGLWGLRNNTHLYLWTWKLSLKLGFDFKLLNDSLKLSECFAWLESTLKSLINTTALGAIPPRVIVDTNMADKSLPLWLFPRKPTQTTFINLKYFILYLNSLKQYRRGTLLHLSVRLTRHQSLKALVPSYEAYPKRTFVQIALISTLSVSDHAKILSQTVVQGR